MFNQKKIKRRMQVAAKQKLPSWYWVRTPGLTLQLSLGEEMRLKFFENLIDAAWENRDNQGFERCLGEFSKLGFTLLSVVDRAANRTWTPGQRIDQDETLTKGAK